MGAVSARGEVSLDLAEQKRMILPVQDEKARSLDIVELFMRSDEVKFTENMCTSDGSEQTNLYIKGMLFDGRLIIRMTSMGERARCHRAFGCR